VISYYIDTPYNDRYLIFILYLDNVGTYTNVICFIHRFRFCQEAIHEVYLLIVIHILFLLINTTKTNTFKKRKKKICNLILKFILFSHYTILISK